MIDWKTRTKDTTKSKVQQLLIQDPGMKYPATNCSVTNLLVTALAGKVMRSVVCARPSVRPSDQPPVSSLSFGSAGPFSLSFAWVWVMIITRRGSKVKIVG